MLRHVQPQSKLKIHAWEDIHTLQNLWICSGQSGELRICFLFEDITMGKYNSPTNHTLRDIIHEIKSVWSGFFLNKCTHVHFGRHVTLRTSCAASMQRQYILSRCTVITVHIHYLHYTCRETSLSGFQRTSNATHVHGCSKLRSVHAKAMQIYVGILLAVL